jgi:cyclohexanone monooxygenase
MTAATLQLPDVGELDFDPAALRRKYDLERDKRLKAEGNNQYVETKDDYAHFQDDPWADPNFSREPLVREVQVLVVGGGFGGLLAGARLREQGFEDICIIEKAGDFGGTWYWNRYPGAACDTESYIYLPLLEETGYMPVSKYARAPEIAEHSRRIGRHFDLYKSALFQTVITGMRWQQDTQRWEVRTNRQDVLTAQFVVLAGGPLHRPKLPGVPGVGSFRGHTFHTSRWDYDYTGGDSYGNLHKLGDKRVGIIGTGATAVQCVPHLGAAAQALYVFQRTPSSVDVRNDRPTDPEWVKSLKPGWQRERVANFTSVVSGSAFEVDLVNDGWTDIIGNILLSARKAAASGQQINDEATLIQLADYRKMERVRARVDDIVKDPTTAEALKPWYNQFCKRPCFHDDYLPTFNRPNVHLVDTDGQGVERITERGVVVAGKEYELDCLIFGTGFEVGTDFTRRLGFEVHGRDGVTLTEKWKGGAQTFHGLFTQGFPNLFVMTTQQSGQSPNFQHMMDEQARHVAWVLDQVRSRGADTVECSEQAEADWVQTIVRYSRARQPFLNECTPGYYNNEGKPDERTARNSPFWRGAIQFLRVWDKWRAEGSLPGLELSRR